MKKGAGLLGTLFIIAIFGLLIYLGVTLTKEDEEGNTGLESNVGAVEDANKARDFLQGRDAEIEENL